MINSAVFMGMPLDFKGICKVYSPLVKEVAYEKNYPLYRSILTTSQEEIEDNYAKDNKDMSDIPTPFQFLLQIYAHDEKYKQICIDALKFFIKEEVTILPEEGYIFIGNMEEELLKVKDITQLRYINDENFFEFQNTCRIALGDDEIPAYDPNMNPKLKAMKAKARLRDKIKAKKSDGIDFSTTLAAICCMGIGITPLNIGEISVGAISTLMAIYQNKEKYQLDIDSLLAGADSKKVKPQYWIRNLDEEKKKVRQ